MRHIGFILLLSLPLCGQTTGILSSARVNDWRHAGLPATYPDGETTPNAWTPPTRTVCTTLSPGTTVAAINSAISSCSASHGVVLLNAGTYTLSGTITLANNVTLRGAGASKTTLSGANIAIGSLDESNSTFLTGSITQGSNTITTSGVAFPSSGRLAFISQCDSGTTASTAGFMVNGGTGSTCAGTVSDPALTPSTATFWVCTGRPQCSASDGGVGNPDTMAEAFWVSNVNGTTVTIDPSSTIEAPNWSTARSAAIGWMSGSGTVGAGLEDIGTSSGVAISGCYGCWIKGVRMVIAGAEQDLAFGNAHSLVANNYFGGNGQTLIVIGGPASPDPFKTESDGLYINNILDGTYMEEDGANHGFVWAYNYIRSVTFNFIVNLDFSHNQDDQMLMLREGDIQGSSQDDDTHGAHNLNTFFRNWLAGVDFGTGQTGNGINIGGWARFENVVGNVIGSTSNASSPYGTNSGILRLNYDNPGTNNCNGGAAGPCDHTSLTDNSSMRWGNYVFCSGDATHCNVSGGTFDSTEVPTTSGSLSTWSAAVQAFANTVPANHNLPPSFFLAPDHSTYITAHPNGGTGLAWWKTCNTWSNFSTLTCSAFTTPPMPPIGPDISGGTATISSGHANNTPAVIAYNSMPVDPSNTTLKLFDESVFQLDPSNLPNLVQEADDIDWNPTIMGLGSWITGQYQTINLAEATTAGNMLTVVLNVDHTTSPPTVTLRDSDLTTSAVVQTFTLANGGDATCTANSMDTYLYYLPNVSGGFNSIRIVWNANNNSGNGPGAVAAEWSNVATTTPLDAYVCSSGTGAGNTLTFSAGSVTPAQTGELVVEHAFNSAVANHSGAGVGTTYTADTGQANINWTKFVDSSFWSVGGQWGVYNTNTALNPSFTITTTGATTPGALRVAAFFKPQAGAGGSHSGIHVLAKKSVNQSSAASGDSFSITPIVTPFPCTGGNLLAAIYSGPGTQITGSQTDVTSITDNLNGAWTANHALSCDSTNHTCTHNYSARNATTSPTLKVTSNWVNLPSDTVYLYCIAGASATPFDKTVVATAAGGTSGGTSLTISPSTSNGLVLMNQSQNSASTLGFNGPTGALFQGCFTSNQNTDGGGCGANNTWGLFHNTDTSSESWQPVTLIAEGFSGFAAEADAYEAPSGPPPPSNVLTVSNGGQGFGSVASNDGFINCGVTCSANYTSGSVVLTATTANISGMLFTGWTVDGSNTICPGKGTCTVSMTANHSVTANFVLGVHAPTKAMFSFR